MEKRFRIIRIGIKNFPAAHGGVEAATYNFVQATKDRYDFAIFTVWDNPTVVNNEIDGVKVYQLAEGWLGRFRQIRAAVGDKKNTILHFHMEIFVPLAIVFSLLGYNVVSSIHGVTTGKVNRKISRKLGLLIFMLDIVGVNLIRRSLYVAKHNYDLMKKYTFRKIWHIPNGSAICRCVNDNPDRDLVFIGRISVQKNLLALIDMADRYERRVDIYGPIDEREGENVKAFEEKIAKSKYAKWCGALSAEQIYPTLAHYRAFVNPSWAEASPNAVIEAGACGLFLYLSDVAGHRNLDFPDVYYFDPHDIQLPLDVMKSPRSYANIEKHRQTHSVEKMIERYGELYGSFG